MSGPIDVELRQLNDWRGGNPDLLNGLNKMVGTINACVRALSPMAPSVNYDDPGETVTFDAWENGVFVTYDIPATNRKVLS
jgi:hypothetical protein